MALVLSLSKMMALVGCGWSVPSAVVFVACELRTKQGQLSEVRK